MENSLSSLRRLSFAAIVFVSLSLPFPAQADPVIGQPAPALTAPGFDLAAMHGQVVVLHFWATWCPSCREEMGVLDKFNQQYRDKGVEVFGVSLDKPRNRKEVEAMMKDFSFPSAMMSDVTENGFGSPPSVPATWIIDKSGTLRAHLTPSEQVLSIKLLEDAVAPLLAASTSK